MLASQIPEIVSVLVTQPSERPSFETCTIGCGVVVVVVTSSVGSMEAAGDQPQHVWLHRSARMPQAMVSPHPPKMSMSTGQFWIVSAPQVASSQT